MLWARTKSLLPGYTLGDEWDIMDNWLGRAFAQPTDISQPGFNIWADADSAVLSGELPGAGMDDLEITANGNTIAIKVSRKAKPSEGAKYVRRERSSDSFERAFELPFRVDAGRVEARLGDGILEINVPRAESDKPRKIAVTVS